MVNPVTSGLNQSVIPSGALQGVSLAPSIILSPQLASVGFQSNQGAGTLRPRRNTGQNQL